MTALGKSRLDLAATFLAVVIGLASLGGLYNGRLSRLETRVDQIYCAVAPTAPECRK